MADSAVALVLRWALTTAEDAVRYRARALTIGIDLLRNVWPEGRPDGYTPIDAVLHRPVASLIPARSQDFAENDDQATLTLPDGRTVPAGEPRIIRLFMAMHINRVRDACLMVVQA